MEEDHQQALIIDDDEKKDERIVAAREKQFCNEIDVKFLKSRDIETKCLHILAVKTQFLYKLQMFKN
jgi:hypothetical protein